MIYDLFLIICWCSVMGILMSSAAGANTLIVPFVGMLSDHTRGPFVHSRPLLLSTPELLLFLKLTPSRCAYVASVPFRGSASPTFC
jgi:hypothetical protein